MLELKDCFIWDHSFDNNSFIRWNRWRLDENEKQIEIICHHLHQYFYILLGGYFHCGINRQFGKQHCDHQLTLVIVVQLPRLPVDVFCFIETWSNICFRQASLFSVLSKLRQVHTYYVFFSIVLITTVLFGEIDGDWMKKKKKLRSYVIIFISISTYC
jgi:membrane protein YqaA with SNARE-associated domain